MEYALQPCRSMVSTLLADAPWLALGPDARTVNPAASMISPDEFRYLLWLVRDCYIGAGAIVDAGPLLGGSTVAIAEALRQNGRVPDKAGRISSYDLFEYWPYMRGLFPDEPEPAQGESLLPRYLANIAPWRDLVEVHPGDIKQYAWTGGPIEILFIDLAKAWSIQAHLLREFFPHLIPGVSIVVQQDYFHPYCYWIALVMEHLADYFTPVHMPAGGTLGFKLEKPIPPELLQLDYEHLFSTSEAVTLLDRAAARVTGAKRLVIMVVKAAFLLARDEVDAAADVLETVAVSPDYDATVDYDFARYARETVARLVPSAEPAVGQPAPKTRVAAMHVHARPVRHRRALTAQDARFLRDLIVEVRPHAAVEILAEPGDSSLVLLDALAEAAPETPSDRPQLYSFAGRDPGDTDRALGRVVHATGHALDARRLLHGQQLRIALIDGYASHPWPAANLLALLPVLAPGAWIVLHDIRFPLLLGAKRASAHGARRLFEWWPGETRRGGTGLNIGAIRLPHDLTEVPAILARMLKEPWDAMLPSDVLATLALEPGSFATDGARALQRMVDAAASGRPLHLWGASQGGRALLEVLQEFRVPVAGFIDRDPRKQGSSVAHLPVFAPSMLDPRAHPRPYIAVSSVFAEEIAAELTASGWQRDVDYATM
jgi:predicted O-methyltransferase YrrM